MDAQHQDVSRFFTAARRFHKLLGKLPDGTRIPGGPYTIVQGLTLVVVLGLALFTRGHLWTLGNVIIDLPFAVAIAVAAAFAAGRLPTRNRNLLTVGLSALHAMGSPAQGRRNGKKLTIRPKHRAASDMVIDWAGSGTAGPVAVEPLEEPAREVPRADPPVATEPGQQLPAAVTGVERLLQQARGGR